jgi:prevent-host-death family protein
MATISAREFNRDVSAAKRAAADGPVVITDRGEPAYVLVTIEDYRRMRLEPDSLVERLSMGEDDDIEFEPGRMRLDLRMPTL